jgi:predicted DNA-binding protein
MSSLRLPGLLEERLSRVAESTGKTKSRLLRDALVRYLDEVEGSQTPYELGKELFGPAESGRTDLSSRYKKLLGEKLREKHSR